MRSAVPGGGRAGAGGWLAIAALLAAGCAGTAGNSGGAGTAGTAGSPGGAGTTARPPAATRPAVDPRGPGRGFPVAGPWVSYHGSPEDADLPRMAREFRILVIDADPVTGEFGPGQIRTLQAGGRNRVLSYLNLGSVERDRDYWERVPSGFVAARDNRPAQLGPYQGYPDEVWMNPADPAWQRLLVDHVAGRLAQAGVDGFYLDNLEVVEHGTGEAGHGCDRRCAQGAFDLVARLRARYPNLLFVMQNAASGVTRTAVTGGRPFPDLLDGLAHEDTFTSAADAPDAAEVTYLVRTDDDTVEQLAAWQRMALRPGGRPFWIATEDYVNACGNAAAATAVFAQARQHGFAAYVSDKSALQETVCFWERRVRGS